MGGVLGDNLACNHVPSSSNDVNRGAGRVDQKGTVQELTPSDGSQSEFPSVQLPCIQIFQGMGLPEIMFEQMIAMVSYCMIHGTKDALTEESMRD